MIGRLIDGRYQVRVAAATEGGQRGTAIYDLEVPDFTRDPVSMSGLAITSVAAGRAPTARGDDPLRDLLPGPPVTNRVFSQGDVLTVFAEFYENMRDAPPHQFAAAVDRNRFDLRPAHVDADPHHRIMPCPASRSSASRSSGSAMCMAILPSASRGHSASGRSRVSSPKSWPRLAARISAEVSGCAGRV